MSFTQAWLAGETAARELLPVDPWRAADRRRALGDASARTIPAGVRAVLARQVPAWEDHDAVAVVTGQQAGLFLGPLYSLYKAAHAVAAARALAESEGRPVLPVFWVASEDHDLPECSACCLPGDGGDDGDRGIVRLEVPPPDGRPIPVACRHLGPSVDTCLDRLEAELDGRSHGGEVVGLLRRHYRPDATWSEAFKGTLRELFDGTDLAIVDPREPALLEAALPIHRKAFERAGELSEALLRRVSVLEERGFEAPVHVRPGAPLPFVHPDGPEGERFRVEPSGDGWAAVGCDRVLSRAEVARWLEEEPGRFSSSALLRPVVQDLLLPTAAIVAGPGEIAYLAQAPPLYEAFERAMPMLLPRARFRIVGARERRLCEQLGVEPDDAARPHAELLALAGSRAAAGDATGGAVPGGTSPEAAGPPDPEALREELVAPFRACASAFAGTARELDAGLAKAVDRAVGAVEDQVGKLVDRYRRTLARRDEVTASRVDRLAGALAPGGAPQERVHGFPAFAARQGVREFRDRILGACELLPTTCRDLET